MSEPNEPGEDPVIPESLDQGLSLAYGTSTSPAPWLEDTGAAAGSVIGRYKLLQLIGEGGMGVVWMAEQQEPVVRKVALKIIKLGMDTKQVTARFEAERQALAMMDHPNIAKVLDGGATDNGRPYFVMELIKGVPITDYCDKAKLDPEERLALFQSVCHAIQHAHQKGIIHRDIKPSNVMITLHDGKPVPKVIDFGIAKATEQRLTEKTMFTEYAQMIGTPDYMSPEQAELSGLDIDTRSDIYSLGVLLYELLTGTKPFGPALMQKGYAEMMRLIRDVDPEKPSTRLSTIGEEVLDVATRRDMPPKRLSKTVRGELDWIVMKCLEKDRARRYGTASGIAMDIAAFLNDDPVVAGPPSVVYRVRKLVKRHRGLVVAATVVAMALILGIVGTTVGMLQAQRELSRANEIKQLVTEMLATVDPELARGKDNALMKRILDDAAQRLDDGVIEDELVRAELHAIIGDVYSSLGFRAEAGKHLPVALEIRRRVLGDEHVDTLRVAHDRARLFGNHGQFEEAAELMEKTFEARRRVLGGEHRDTLRSMIALTKGYSSLGRQEAVEKLANEAVETAKRVLGDTDPDTMDAMNTLGVHLMRQYRLREADELFTALLANRRASDEDRRKMMSTFFNLAEVRNARGRYTESEAIALEGVEIATELFAKELPRTRALSILGVCYMRSGRFAEATKTFEQAEEIETARTQRTGDRPDLRNRCYLARAYVVQGLYEKARDLLKPVHDGTRGLVRTAATGLLTLCHEGLGQKEEAATMRAQWVQLASRGSTSRRAFNHEAALSLLAPEGAGLDDLKRARTLAQLACDREKEQGGSMGWVFLETLARAQHRCGETEKAIQTAERALTLVPEMADALVKDRLEARIAEFRGR